MAQPQAARPRRPKPLRTIALVLLALIVLVGIAVLITWLTIRPRRLVFTVEDGSIHNFNLTDNHLNATFDFAIRSYNPNSKVSIYYDKMEVSVNYDGQTIAFNMVDPFFQPHRNVTRLEVKLTAQYLALSKSTSRDLRLERSSGKIELNVLLKAKIRFKVGVWKSRHRTLRSMCSPVLVPFPSYKHFERTFCEVEL